MLPQVRSLPDLLRTFPDDASALKHFEAIRWREGAFCPYCKSARVMHFKDGKTHKCSDCRKRFSIRTGTIFEDSKLPMNTWFAAIWMLTNHPKGVASTQLAKDLGITQKSAWFVLHRLRYAARTKSFNRPLSGRIEADETYLGGRAKNMSKARRERSGVGVGGVGKTIVMGVLERANDGKPKEVRAAMIPDTTTRTIQARVRDHVAPGATLMTDSASA
jgi:transposase-like protein